MQYLYVIEEERSGREGRGECSEFNVQNSKIPMVKSLGRDELPVYSWDHVMQHTL